MTRFFLISLVKCQHSDVKDDVMHDAK